jgi:hypothetical protein
MLNLKNIIWFGFYYEAGKDETYFVKILSI